MCGFHAAEEGGGGERARVLTLPRALVKLIKSKYFVLRLLSPHSLSLFL